MIGFSVLSHKRGVREFGTEKTQLDERLIGSPLEDLERADRVIALAGGAKKTAAIAGALRNGVWIR